MKKYEAVYSTTLTPNSSVLVRVDGRAFHTWTKGLDKPYDITLINCMANAAMDVAKEMAGFKLAYVQSDEATFLITDTDSHETQGWFDYKVNKLVSVTASAFTAYFNREASWKFDRDHQLAMFDARAFVVPEADVPNAFIWRQQDWERNSLQMAAHWYYSQADLRGKSSAQMHEMLHKFGFNWAHLDPVLKNGTWITRGWTPLYDKLDYYQIRDMIDSRPEAKPDE